MATKFKLIPLLLIVLGLGFFALSRVPGGGFVTGLFLGAGGALVAIGAYLFVQALRSAPHADEGDAMWRPSADAEHERD